MSRNWFKVKSVKCKVVKIFLLLFLTLSFKPYTLHDIYGQEVVTV